jgi:hypothetical protein
MGFALAHDASRFKAVFPLEVEFTTYLVNVEPQVVVAEREKQVFRQPREEVSTLVVARGEELYGR